MSKITKCAAYYIFAPVVTYVICLVASNEMLGLVHTVPNRHKQKHDPDMRTKEVKKASDKAHYGALDWEPSFGNIKQYN